MSNNPILKRLLTDTRVMCVPCEETVDGFEMQVAVRSALHLSLWKISDGIKGQLYWPLPILENPTPNASKTTTAPPKGKVRIISVSSDRHAKLEPKEDIVFSDMNMKDNYFV